MLMETKYEDPVKQSWAKPSIRQLKFLATYAKTKDKTESANRAWPNAGPLQAARLVKTTLSMPIAQDLLRSVGVGVDDTAKAHKQLLHATKKVNLGGFIEEVPNDEVRMRAVETAYKIHGLLSQKADAVGQVNVQVNNVDPEKLAAVVARLDSISSNLQTRTVPTGEVIDVAPTNT
jgi:hypothetical protein